MLAGDHHERKGIKLDRNLGRRIRVCLNPGGSGDKEGGRGETKAGRRRSSSLLLLPMGTTALVSALDRLFASVQTTRFRKRKPTIVIRRSAAV